MKLKRPQWLSPWLIVALLYVVLSSLYMGAVVWYRALPMGDDLRFHLLRILGLTTIHISPINFLYNDGVGVNWFYGWETLYPLVVLYRISHRLIASYALFMWFVTWATFMTTHWSAYQVFKQHRLSWLLSVLYTLSLYRQVDVFMRADMGEVLALIALPLVFVGMIWLFDEQVTGFRRWGLLASALAFIGYSHVLMFGLTMMGVLLYSIAKFYGFWRHDNFSWLKVKPWLSQGVLMAGLLAFFGFLY